MSKQTVFLTGATGTMGYEALTQMVDTLDDIVITILVQETDTKKNKILRYQNHPKVKIVWGDLLQYEKVRKCIKDVQLVFHVAALVSPAADYDPELTMQVNYGSTRNIVRAIKELGQANLTKLVYIGSVAETGDRRPPIHWGRIGDPIKPSILDYYAVSKVAAERYVIESSLSYWVSLRQTGMMSPAMAQVEDPIMFHNGLWNGLEYISVRDSGRLLCNICHYERENALDRDFWGHIFNIGGGKDCRISTYNLFREMFEQIGLKDVSRCIDMKWFATENFHGHYYLDSDRLENILHFRRIASKEHAPWYAMEHQQEELTKKDMDEAVKFRGGRLLSMVMKPGDWSTTLRYECAFGHQFSASPRLILEGGHWCPICEQESWNYGERAKRDPFFAQVWYPLHAKEEICRKYPKNYRENEVQV